MIYIVVDGKDIREFVEEVNESTAKGFRPIGGIMRDIYDCYHQALILEDEVKSEMRPKKTVQPIDITVLSIGPSSGMGLDLVIRYTYNDEGYEFITDKLDSKNTISMYNLEVKLLCIKDLESR